MSPDVAPGAAGVGRYRGPEYQRLLAAARRSLERTGGQLDGRISVADPDDAERKAIIGITGLHQPAGTRRMTVSLESLDAAVRRATGHGLAELLTALGPPLRNRPGAAASLAASRAELVALAEASPLYLACDWYRQWLGELRQDGTLTRLATQGGLGILAQGVHLLEFLEGHIANTESAGAGPVALPALAAQITGDTKALNNGTALGTLILRALALRAGVARPRSAAERRDLWDRAGVLVDDLASRVLVLNLPAAGEGLGEWLTGAARYGTPFQVTLHQLTAHPVKVSCPRIFVCENPAVLRRACAELGAACPPLVCTEGPAVHGLPPAHGSGGRSRGRALVPRRLRLAWSGDRGGRDRPLWRTALADGRERLPGGTAPERAGDGVGWRAHGYAVGHGIASGDAHR